MPTSYTAYTVYAYPVGLPSIGMAGRIIDNGAVSASPNLQTGMNGAAQVEGVVAPDGTLCVAVDSYVTGSAVSPNIYDIASPSLIANPTWNEVDNPWAMAALGDYVYVADWDNGRVVEIDPSDWSETGAYFDFATDSVTDGLAPNGYQANCTALLVINSALYGLFSVGLPPYYGSYVASVVVKFTIDPTNTIEVASASDYNSAVEKNAYTMAESSGYIYIACIGGPQTVGGNPDSKLQSVQASSLSTAPVTKMAYNATTFPYEFRDISFNGSTAYVLAAAYNTGWASTSGLLLSTTNFSTTSTIDTITNVSGYLWAAQYTPDLNRIWYGRGNQIKVLNASTNATVSTLGVVAGQLMNTGQSFTNVGEMTYVGAVSPLPQAIRGYRSPVQASKTPHAAAARAIAQGRPELTEEECERLAND